MKCYKNLLRKATYKEKVINGFLVSTMIVETHYLFHYEIMIFRRNESIFIYVKVNFKQKIFKHILKGIDFNLMFCTIFRNLLL